LKLPTVRLSVQVVKQKVNSFVNQVDVDNMDTFGLNLNLMKLEKDLSSKIKLSVEKCRVITSVLLKKVLKKRWKVEYLQGIHYLMSKRHHLLGPPTLLTIKRWHL